MTFIFPTFQAQNPAISGCPQGWASCTCFAGAMAAAFDRGTSYVMKGCSVRTMTHDTSGGTTLAQVDAALLEGWGVNLNTVYRLPWASFAAAINSGKGAILQGWYAPIADSRFDAGNGFRGNHAVTVLPGWVVMDPLADGRTTGVYKYHHEAYPQSLLRSFAGKLNLGGSSYRPLGDGLVYCSLTRDRTKTWVATVRPVAGSYLREYARHRVSGSPLIDHLPVEKRRTKGFEILCSPPQNILTTAGTRVSLVQLNKPGSVFDNWWISSRWAQEV